MVLEVILSSISQDPGMQQMSHLRGGGLMKKLLTKIQEGLRVTLILVMKQGRNNNEGDCYHPGPDRTRVGSGCRTRIKSQL